MLLTVRHVMMPVFFWDSNLRALLPLKRQDKIGAIYPTSTARPATLLFWAPLSNIGGKCEAAVERQPPTRVCPDALAYRAESSRRFFRFRPPRRCRRGFACRYSCFGDDYLGGSSVERQPPAAITHRDDTRRHPRRAHERICEGHPGKWPTTGRARRRPGFACDPIRWRDRTIRHETGRDG